jgi:hypothetical protein
MKYLHGTVYPVRCIGGMYRLAFLKKSHKPKTARHEHCSVDEKEKTVESKWGVKETVCPNSSAPCSVGLKRVIEDVKTLIKKG